MHIRHFRNLLAIAAAVALYSSSRPTANAQICSSIDGNTDCLQAQSPSQMKSPQFESITSMSIDRAVGADQPVTLGSITFRGNGTACIGLLNRGRCNY